MSACGGDAGVPNVAGGMRQDRAALKFEELDMLFG